MDSTYTHPALPAFAAIAERFCTALVNGDSRAPADQLRELHELLPALYAAALALPSTSVLFDDDSDRGDDDDPSIDASAQLNSTSQLAGLARLAEFLGTRLHYREVFDPYSDPDDAEVIGDLLDDFSDIFRELNAGLREWHAGNPGSALWNWRFSFESHWGEHATSALRALFALCAWYDGDWPAGAA